MKVITPRRKPSERCLQLLEKREGKCMGNFEFDGQKYKNASTHQKEWGTRIISELNLKGTERILDLGCGDGVLTKLLAEKVPEGKVLGVDASIGMLDTAKEKSDEEYSVCTATQKDIPELVRMFLLAFRQTHYNLILSIVNNSIRNECEVDGHRNGIVI